MTNMTNILYFAGTTIIMTCGLTLWKIYGGNKYKVIKDSEYKNFKIQVIVNPENNVCGFCYEILELNEEISKFLKCDHHFHNECIINIIDQIKSENPCPMCMK